MHECMSRSDATWSLDGLSTVMFFRAFLRDPGALSSMTYWVQKHVSAPDHPDHERERSRLLADAPDQLQMTQLVREGFKGKGEPAIYCSGPLANLEQGCRPHVELLGGVIARGIDAAASIQYRPVPLRLLYMSERVVDGERHSPESWLAQAEIWLREEADGLIITDVAQRAPGFGAGVEVMLHAGHRGPRLFLLDCHCSGHSRLEEALAARLDASFEWFESPADVPELVARWVDESYEELLASRRRRINLRLAYAAAHARTAALIEKADPQLLSRSLQESGVRFAEIWQALHGVEGWLALDPSRRAKLELMLGGLSERKPQRRAAPLSTQGLREAARKQGWGPAAQRELLLAVKAELEVAGAAHRLPAMSAEDWIEAHERLFGAR
jgi:hypothetical protein